MSASLWSPHRRSGIALSDPGTLAGRLGRLEEGDGLRPSDSPSAPRVTDVATTTITGYRGTPWRLVDIREQSRPLVDQNGAPLLLPTGQQVGMVRDAAGTVRAWISPMLARACSVYARQQWRIASGAHDPAALERAFQYAMATYNALNIPWDIDPVARAAWRRYVSGAATNAASEWSAEWDYNDATANRDQLSPRVLRGQTFGGTIPGRAREVFVRCLPAGVSTATTIAGQFQPFVWMGLGLPPQLPPQLPGDDLGGLGIGPTRSSDRVQATAGSLQNYADRRSPGAYGTRWGRVVDADCTLLPNPGAAAPPWDAYGFDDSWIGPLPPLRFGAATADWLALLDAILSGFEARTPEQVVLDARTFVAYLNGMTALHNGGSLDQAARAMGAAAAAEWAPNAGAASDLRIVQSGAGALTALVGALALAAGASAPLTAGISGLVVGSIAALTAVGIALWPSDASLIKLDDCLRPRPWLSRAWLDGTIADQTSAGAPVNIAIDPPPGYDPNGPSTALGSHTATTVTPGGSSAPGSSTPLLVGASALAVGGVLGANALGWIDLASLFRGK
jgi:hypothetical protein